MKTPPKLIPRALGKQGPPVRLCLLGSAACLFGGMDGRTSDLDDIRFLASRHRPDLKRVRRIVARFPTRARQSATENLVYLDVLET
jgi:hypothetical protein